jgi:antitoxin component YwqK of YwqJK toxin-antitoxin module
VDSCYAQFVTFIIIVTLTFFLFGCDSESETENFVVEPQAQPLLPLSSSLERTEENHTHTNNKKFTLLPRLPKVKNGLVFDWYETREKKEETNYQNGIKNGAARRWYKNGQLKQECSFLHDRYHGVFQSWYENGKLRAEGSYLEGKHDGEWILYDRDGNKMPSIYYENGVEVTRSL